MQVSTFTDTVGYATTKRMLQWSFFIIKIWML